MRDDSRRRGLCRSPPRAHGRPGASARCRIFVRPAPVKFIRRLIQDTVVSGWSDRRTVTRALVGDIAYDRECASSRGAYARLGLAQRIEPTAGEYQ